jgi:pimeloyl-ACP methyl ester carboxylesterase
MLARKVTNEPLHFDDVLAVGSGGVHVVAELAIPAVADGLVVFCHGARNRRHGAANLTAARLMTENGLGAAVCNLLTTAEENIDERIPGPRFDVKRLAGRLADVTDALGRHPRTSHFPIAYFAASTLAAAALVAAASRPLAVRAVVSLGGLPELAEESLTRVKAPTLLLVGERDWKIMDRNAESLAVIPAEKSLLVVPEGTHLFSDPGALAVAVGLARDWFRHYLSAVPSPA